MPTRSHGRNVARRSANVTPFRLLPDAKLTRFGAEMAILLRKWCTFAYQARHRGLLPQNEPRPHGQLSRRILLALQPSPPATATVRHGVAQPVRAEAAHVQEAHSGDFLALRLTPPPRRGFGFAATSLNDVGGVLIRTRRTASNFALSTAILSLTSTP